MTAKKAEKAAGVIRPNRLVFFGEGTDSVKDGTYRNESLSGDGCAF
jgi:hypothetical protein